MSTYKYAYGLKAPDRSIDVNLEKPAVVRMMQVVCRNKQRCIALPEKLQGKVILENRSYQTWDGSALNCFIVTPMQRGTDSPKNGPAMICLHGGAFALPIQQAMINLACHYADALGIVVYIPEYRLLPEYAGATALRDCIAFWDYLNGSGLQHSSVSIYGESAGGGLAAGLAMWIRDYAPESRENKAGLPVTGLALIYPVLDRSEAYPSKKAYEDAAWSARSNRSMWNAYLKDASEEWMPYLVPMEQADMSGLPRCYLEPQEIDILKDEAHAFADRLKEAGIQVTLREIKGSYHSFDGDYDNPFVQRILRQRVQDLKRLL